MIKTLLSRYSPKYPRSLVYMLQSSDYDIGEYLAWYLRTPNFRQVEKRKKLEMTTKARLLLATLWVMATIILAIIVTILWLGHGSAMSWLLALATIIIAPYLLALGIILPLWLGKVLIQGPQEWTMVVRARQILATHPATKVAIVGSFGKTTFKETLATILAEGKQVSATPGNMNTPIGISRFVEQLKGDKEILIFEMGEYYPGDINALCHLAQPDIGIITGVNEAHLSRFKTLERTTATIFELADYVGDKPLLVNGESKLAAGKAQVGHLVYSRRGLGNWRVDRARTSLEGTSFQLTDRATTLHVTTKLLGLHQIGPLVACIDIAFKLGLSSTQIKHGLAKVQPYEHRLQPRAPGPDGVHIIDDTYNGSPDGVRAAIEFLRDASATRKLYVTPGLLEMGDSSAAVHTDIGHQLAGVASKVILIRNSVTPFIAAALEEKAFATENIIWFDDATACYAALPSLTVAGDLVLLQNDWTDNYA